MMDDSTIIAMRLPPSFSFFVFTLTPRGCLLELFSFPEDPPTTLNPSGGTGGDGGSPFLLK